MVGHVFQMPDLHSTRTVPPAALWLHVHARGARDTEIQLMYSFATPRVWH